jgi:hypothetical protein
MRNRVADRRGKRKEGGREVAREAVGPQGRKERGGLGWKRRKVESGKRVWVFSFFSKLLFKLLNLNSFQNLNTSSPFQNFQNNLKTFKTSRN